MSTETSELTRSDWFYRSRWGAASHFLVEPQTDADEWNRRVDRFDVGGLAGQLAEVGAGYYWLTIGQNSGHYCSPNSTYDACTGIRPSKCSGRDLIAELAEALASRGVRMMVYLPSGAPAADPAAMRALGWEWGFEGGWPEAWGTRRTGKRLAEFQRTWEAVIREWSLRWGGNVHGWWFDGCYFADEMYRFSDEPNFFSLAAAARAGNPDSLVAFNPGIMVQAVTPAEDYTAGETNEPGEVEPPPDRWFGTDHREQFHVWSYLGQSWMQPPPRFDREDVVAHTRRLTARGGVMTWDVPLSPFGLIPEPFFDQLAAVGKCIRPQHRDSKALLK